ncbi:MAG: M48 family metallopeptidase [Chloroflexi bacterium]|nr:M48 family metallopeptidase [Chloroflexota bacterium]
MPIDPERQKQAKEYARIHHRLFALNLVLTGLALLGVLALGLNVWLKQVILSLTHDAWLATFLYFVVALVAYEGLFFPLAYYRGLVLPHRYGLSTQTQRAWLVDVAKGGTLTIILGGLVVEVIYSFLRGDLPLPLLSAGGAGGGWWLWASAFMILFSVVLANLAPVLIFPLFFKFKPLEDAELVHRLTALAERARTRVRGVYTMMLSEKTTAANAALMGLGNTRRIVLGDTLYQNYTHDEIETVLAHELGHHVHHDIGWGLIVQSGLTLAGFYIADVFLKWTVAWLGYEGIADLAAFPLLGLAFGIFGLITMPLTNAYSRWREALADDYALATTRNAPGFVGAMEKLANQNLAELEPEPWVEFLLYDHPPIGKRLKRATGI